MAVAESLLRAFDTFWPSVILGAAGIVLYLWSKIAVQLDPREPPALQSKIPVIGHIVGLLYHSVSYFHILYKKTPLPICTLPMLGGKVYVINEPALVQSAFRSRNLSFAPLTVEFGKRMLGLPDEDIKPFFPVSGSDATVAPFITDMFQVIHASMQNQYVHKMNVNALGYVADVLHAIPVEGLEIPNLYLWLREFITIATTEALYGKDTNPWKKDPSLVDALWTFDDNLVPILINIAPALTVRKGYLARAKLQQALNDYYLQDGDLAPDVAQIVKMRAATVRKYGFSKDKIGAVELPLAFVATTNTIPTLFWLLINIFAQPVLVEKLRQAALNVIQEEEKVEDNKKRIITINIANLESTFPLLVSCYQESLRLGNVGVHSRRVVEDTVISDGQRSYLLKAGFDVQLPVAVNHLSGEVWGPNFLEFDGERFLSAASREKEEEDKYKLQKSSYHPFGGGKHLCPGRRFAFAENLGTLTAFLLGYEVTDAQGGVLKVPPMRPVRPGEGVCKPVENADLRSRIRRRVGWENVEWRFVSE